MKQTFYNFNQSGSFFSFSVIISAISIMTILGLHVFFYNQLPLKLPLFYSLPWGDQQLVLKQQFFILPAVLGLFCLINLFIVTQLHISQIILKKVLLSSVILLDFIFLITAFKIILIFV